VRSIDYNTWRSISVTEAEGRSGSRCRVFSLMVSAVVEPVCNLLTCCACRYDRRALATVLRGPRRFPILYRARLVLLWPKTLRFPRGGRKSWGAPCADVSDRRRSRLLRRAPMAASCC